MALPRTVAAVVFDCDGLLVDTETGWTRAETAIFAEHGHTFGPEQKEIVIGRTLAAAGLHVAGVPSLPDANLAADTLFPSLTDPALTRWAATATRA